MWFQVCAIMQTQLTALSQAAAWGEVERPRQDVAFLMIVPSTNAGGDQVLSLAAVWVHPCQGHLSTLVEAAKKLMLLADDGPDWPYTFVCMNDTVSQVPLCDKGHIGAMMDSVCSTNVWWAPPATGVEVAATWWLCSVPRGTKWGAQGSSILFPGAATLECCHYRWTHPRYIPDKGGTGWHRTQDCQHHTGAIPFQPSNLWVTLL